MCFPGIHLGTEWLKRQTSALLEVPTAFIPETLNLLLNATPLAISQPSAHP